MSKVNEEASNILNYSSKRSDGEFDVRARERRTLF